MQDRIARAGLRQVLDDLRQLEDGNLELLWRTLHQRGSGRDQQQGPSDYQALLWREVLGHALEPADPGPEPGVGGGGADHRRATRDRQRPEGRISRVLHLKTEEPEYRILYGLRYQAWHVQIKAHLPSFMLPALYIRPFCWRKRR